MTPVDVPNTRIQIRHELRPGDVGYVLTMHGYIYCRDMGWDLTFEGYVAESLAEFAKTCNPERDRLWIAEIIADPTQSETLCRERRRSRDAEAHHTYGSVAEPIKVGAIGIVSRTSTEAQLRWFLVAPVMRSHGLGRQMLTVALDFCRDRGYRRVYLWTVSGLDAAAHLYRWAGFRKTQSITHEVWGAIRTEERYDLVLQQVDEVTSD